MYIVTTIKDLFWDRTKIKDRQIKLIINSIQSTCLFSHELYLILKSFGLYQTILKLWTFFILAMVLFPTIPSLSKT